MKRLLLALLTIAFYHEGSGQVILNGLIVDSLSHEPLPAVTIRIQNSARGTISNERGYYLMAADPLDSIVFSSVGYVSSRFRASDLVEQAVIYLRQAATPLDTIEIRSIVIPGIANVGTMSPLRNMTADPYRSKIPGDPVVETFGPGIVIGGVFSRFSKKEKELSRLDAVKKENAGAQSYISIVNDSAVVKEVTELYNVSREVYFDILSRFNAQYGSSVYNLPKDELISSLILFFGREMKKEE